ncbi:MAG: ankyrin repeat domain-containing protein, partial [Planctomycetota bacterium]
GITPLMLVCQRGDAKMLDCLLDHNVDVNAVGPGKVTPLMVAALAGDVGIVDALLASGADVNAKQRQGQTALMWAAAAGHAAVAERMLRSGGDVSMTTDQGYTALMLASRQGHIQAAMTLIDFGADVDQAITPKRRGGRWPRKGLSPLMLAVESAHFELALRLIDRGADPNDQRSGRSPLHSLAAVRRPQSGDDPNGDPPPRGSGNVTAVSFVRQIVARGADVNLRLSRGSRPKGKLNPRGATPFLMAAQTVDLPLMAALIDCGADPLAGNADGTTPLMAAAGIGNHFVGEHPGTPEEVRRAIDYLIELGHDVNAVDKNGETAMHGAAYRCFPDTVRCLVGHGAKATTWNHVNEYGWTPLTIAKGYRPGSFKPDPATIEAIREALAGMPDAREKDPKKGWNGSQ